MWDRWRDFLAAAVADEKLPKRRWKGRRLPMGWARGRKKAVKVAEGVEKCQTANWKGVEHGSPGVK